MKNLLSLLLLLAIAAPAKALTKVKGYITTNTTWTKANSPYVLTGGLLVQHGVTLTIEPGTEVQSTSSYNFWVEGKLIAIGTPTDSIILTSESTLDLPNGWRGINFRSVNGATEGEFQYCSIRNSIYAINTDTATTLIVKNCYFRTHDIAINVPSGNFEVTNNRFDYCTALADNYIPGFPSKGIFKDNQVSFAKLGAALRHNSSEISVNNNSFYDCPYGIVLSEANKVSVTENKILKCGVGILATSSHPQLTVEGNMLGDCEEALRVTDANGSFKHNSFRSNNKALIVNETSPGFMFEYNCIDTNTAYYVILNSVNDINLKNNWWGTTDSNKMHTATHDFDQDATLGHISFGPYLASQPVDCKVVPDNPWPTYLPDVVYAATISIYPNPITSSFTVQVSNASTIKNIEVYNTVGAQLINRSVSATQADVDMSAHAPGLYLYKITTANGQLHTGRLLKQ